MQYIADLHVHSHYSRATSKDLNLESLYQWSRIKGIHVVGTGDFTHPAWFKEIREKLESDGNGLFKLKNPPREPGVAGMKVQDIDVRFCLTTEISSIYKYGDKVRKNHNLVYAPDFDTVARINARLARIGNLEADGRPILGLPSRDLLEIVLESSPQSYLIPAHVWTPWFSTLGSKGGYDSIDECFRDLTHHIFAIETGLSSDPAMNWKWSALDRFTLISNSDAHSAQKLGREANLLNTEMSYEGLFNAIKTRKGFSGTYEFFPEEGKYHHDGHRSCGISLNPKETMQCNGLCPQCGEPLTIGVLHRLEKLIDRTEPIKPVGATDFNYIIPLPEILAEINHTGTASKAVAQAFQQAISAFGNEFSLLNDVPVEDIQKQLPVLAEAIRRMRLREVNPIAGYDGLYGVIKIFKEGELKKLSGQLHFFNEEPAKQAPSKIVKPGNAPQTDTNGHNDKPVMIAQLNLAQQQVKEKLNGAVLVKAGPGTGKTSTLIQWISNQVNEAKVPPAQILAITFTNKAAHEIQERLMQLAGKDMAGMRIGTFHAVAYRLLQQRDPLLHTVYDEESRLSAIRFLFPALKESECKKLCEALANWFELGQADGFEDCTRYAKRYREFVQKQHAIDLSDIIRQVVDAWKQDADWLQQCRHAVQAIAVDEFQDINALQYEFLQLLCAGKNILAIGDPDQAIYGFRGADVQLFFQFAGDFNAATVNLTENYRSTQTILQAAGEVIQHNTVRSGVQLQATKSQGVAIKCFQADDVTREAKFIIGEIGKQVGGLHLLTTGSKHHGGQYAFSDIAILFRTHAVGRELLMHLKRSEIPVHLTDGTAFLRQRPFTIIADILRLVLQPNDIMALQGILQYALHWDKQEIKKFLSSLYEKDVQWQQAIPIVSARSKENYEQFTKWYNTINEVVTQEGVAGLVKDIFRRYIPLDQLSDEQLLKKETIGALANEAGQNVKQFVEDNTLNNYTETGNRQAYGIHLITFHAAKGLEFPVVFVAGAEEGITPSRRDNSNIEEERRLFYVALTRAKEQLYITHASSRTLYGQEQQQEPSSFLHEIPEQLTEVVKLVNKNKKNNDGQHQMSMF